MPPGSSLRRLARRAGDLFRGTARRRAPHLRLGARGERIAARALSRSGYRVVARNYRPGRSRRYAEIDIVAWEGRTLAVVEVKTRRGGLGNPAERVDARKRLRLRRSAARMWRKESERRRIPPGSRLRMDVVEVWFPKPPAIRRPPIRLASPASWLRLRRRPRPAIRIRRDAF